MSKFYYTN